MRFLSESLWLRLVTVALTTHPQPSKDISSCCLANKNAFLSAVPAGNAVFGLGYEKPYNFAQFFG